MLRKVCFQFDQETMDVLRGKMEALLADLAAHGVTVHGLRESEKQAESAECLQTVFECPACGHKTDEIMYITDRGKPYDALRAAGCHVLPCLHEHNREEAFPGAVYAVEKIEETDFASLDMAYRRLAGLPWEILETERLLVRRMWTAFIGFTGSLPSRRIWKDSARTGTRKLPVSKAILRRCMLFTVTACGRFWRKRAER